MQYTLPLSNHKNGHGRRDRDLAADLTHWIADLDAAEALRREQFARSPNCARRSTGTRRHAA